MNCIKERLLKSLDRRREWKSLIEEFGKGWCELNNLNYDDYINQNIVSKKSVLGIDQILEYLNKV